MNYLCRRIQVDLVADKGDTFQEDTSAPRCRYRKSVVCRKEDEPPQRIMEARSVSKGKHNTDPPRCHSLQMDLKACHMEYYPSRSSATK